MEEKLEIVSHKNTWILISSIIVTALIVGFGVYFFQQSEQKRTLSDLELVYSQKIKMFEEKLDVVEHSNSSATSTTSDSIFKDRMLLTKANFNTYFSEEELIKNCPYFNGDSGDYAAVEAVTYENKGKGIQIKVPYNPAWGNNVFRIEPYESYDNTVYFGSVHARGEGCGWFRKYYLSFRKQRPAEEIIAELKQSDADGNGFVVKPKIVEIGNLKAITYEASAMCGGGGYEIIGVKANYLISGICGGSTVELDKTLEEVIKSIKLIN